MFHTMLLPFLEEQECLIIVGVVLDTMRQVETFLLQRHYDGFLRKGRIKGRSTNTGQGIESLELKDFEAQWRPLLAYCRRFVFLRFHKSSNQEFRFKLGELLLWQDY